MVPRISILIILIFGSFFAVEASTKEVAEGKIAPVEVKLNLVKAVMCESLKEKEFINEAIVFSFLISKVICFADFDSVPDKTFVYHNWYFREQKRASVKLTLNSPRWATFSTVQIGETDKGPWRVEITDPQGNILKTLRFSITD